MAIRTPMEDRELAYLEELVKTSRLTPAQTERLATLQRKGEERQPLWIEELQPLHGGGEVRWSTPTLPTVNFRSIYERENLLTLFDEANANRRQYEGRWLPRGLREANEARRTAEECQAHAVDAFSYALMARREGDREITFMAFDEAVNWAPAPKLTLRQRIADRVSAARFWLSRQIHELGDWVDPYG